MQCKKYAVTPFIPVICLKMAPLSTYIIVGQWEEINHGMFNSQFRTILSNTFTEYSEHFHLL